MGYEGNEACNAPGFVGVGAWVGVGEGRGLCVGKNIWLRKEGRGRCWASGLVKVGEGSAEGERMLLGRGRGWEAAEGVLLQAGLGRLRWVGLEGLHGET